MIKLRDFAVTQAMSALVLQHFVVTSLAQGQDIGQLGKAWQESHQTEIMKMLLKSNRGLSSMKGEGSQAQVPPLVKDELEIQIEKASYSLFEAMYRLLDVIKDPHTELTDITKLLTDMNAANKELMTSGRGIEFGKVKTAKDIPELYTTMYKTYTQTLKRSYDAMEQTSKDRTAAEKKGVAYDYAGPKTVDIVVWGKFLENDENIQNAKGFDLENRLTPVKREFNADTAVYTYCGILVNGQNPDKLVEKLLDEPLKVTVTNEPLKEHPKLDEL
jgi:hypothetical protein